MERWLHKDPIELAERRLQIQQKDDIADKVQERIRKAIAYTEEGARSLFDADDLPSS
jgi:TPP-dependent pyruvate/acetoin dehydrogenase alpha subunit